MTTSTAGVASNEAHNGRSISSSRQGLEQNQAPTVCRRQMVAPDTAPQSNPSDLALPPHLDSGEAPRHTLERMALSHAPPRAAHLRPRGGIRHPGDVYGGIKTEMPWGCRTARVS